MIQKSTKFKQTQLGPIPEDWEILTISDVAEVVGGGTPSTNESANFNDEIPWLTPRDLSNYQFRYISKGERGISKLSFKNSGAKLLPKGSILLTSRAPVGYVAIAANDIATNQGFKSLVPNKEYSSEFLYYLLKNNEEFLKSNSSGSTFLELSGSVLKQLKFAFPNITEQDQIAEILSSLDDKIELNRRMNKTLEAIGHAIFKRWFVQEDLSEWKGGELGQLIEITSGQRPNKRSEQKDSEFSVPLIGASGIMGYVDEYLYDGNEEILIIGRVGTHGIVQRVKYPCWPSDNTLVIKSKYKNFIYQLLKIIDYGSLNRGSTQPLITQGDLKKYAIIIPEEQMLKRFEATAGGVYDMVDKNNKEIEFLTQLRDSLLPRLMSGKIRVTLKLQL